MDRLSYRDAVGHARLTLFGKQMYCSTQATAECFAKLEESLAAYKDTGLEPEEVKSIKETWDLFGGEDGMQGVYMERDKYKRAESEGRLIILPCKVGDTVYEITNLPGDDAIRMRFVAEIAWMSGHGTVLLSSGLVIGLDDFGKTVFRSHEEAEAALGGDGDG